MGTIEKMTVHKALAELKLLDGRIDKAIAEGIYCVANKHSNDKINGIDITEYKKLMQGRYDKVVNLIDRRKALKKAVTLSNAVTKVTINGNEYTVAEAIEMRNSGILHEDTLCKFMEEQYKKALAEIKTRNEGELEERAEDYVKAMFGQKEGKANTAEAEKLRKEFIANNSYELLDPLKINEKIEALEKNISDFMSEVDAALSTSNALTEITIEY